MMNKPAKESGRLGRKGNQSADAPSVVGTAKDSTQSATAQTDALQPLPIERFVARKDFWIGRLGLPDVSK